MPGKMLERNDAKTLRWVGLDAIARSPPAALGGWPRLRRSPGQSRRLPAGPLDLVHRLRRARGQHLVTTVGDEDVVLDAHADAAVLRGDRMDHRFRARLLLVLDLLRRARAEPEAALPHLL